ncbi:MAG: Site-specific tyrosine recombinase XerD, partial [uncultured Corynebacteriales bacterium]
ETVHTGRAAGGRHRLPGPPGGGAGGGGQHARGVHQGPAAVPAAPVRCGAARGRVRGAGRGVPGRPAGGRRGPPAAVGVLRGPGGGGGARAAPLRRPGRHRPGRRGGRGPAADPAPPAAQGDLGRRRGAAALRRVRRRHPLGAARPGAARGALRHRRADLRGGRAGRGRPGRLRPGRRGGGAAREGRQGARRPGRLVRPPGGRGLPGPGPAGAGRGRARDAAAVPQRPRRPAVPAERLDDPAGRRRARRAGRRGLPAHAASLVRDPPAGRGSGRAGGAGAARPRVGEHHAGLHAGDGGPAARGVRHGAPAGPV